MKYFISALILFSSSADSTAQYYDWTIYNTSNSPLQSNAVDAFALDHDSAIWFCTPHNIYRLHNNTWTVFDTIATGHNFNIVNQITVDNDNNKWFATYNGLLKFDNVSWTWSTASNSNLPGDHIMAITTDHDNLLWMSFQDVPGFYSFDGNNWNVYNADTAYFLHDAYASRIAVDNYNNKYFAGDGVKKFNGVEWTWQQWPYTFQGNDYTTSVSTIDINNSNERWLGLVPFVGGLGIYNDAGPVDYNQSNSGISWYYIARVAFDSTGNTWIGGGGLYRLIKFDGANWIQYNPVNSPLPSSNTNDVVVGADNKIYLATSDAGLVVLEESLTGVDCSDTNYIPIVTASGVPTICAGDSITLQAQAGYNSYLWSTGETTRSIRVSTADAYSVTVPVDACLFTSDTIEINVSDPMPIITAIGCAPDLISNHFDTYQWYYNNDPIQGAIYQTYHPVNYGEYYVVVTDEYSCIGYSSVYEYACCCPGIEDIADVNIAIYPNPATAQLTLETTIHSATPLQTEIRNLQGQLVYSSTENASAGMYKKSIELNLAQGIYYLTLQSSEGSVTKKVEVVR